MDFSSRYSEQVYSESSPTVYRSLTEYQLNYKNHWLNMHSMSHDSLNKNNVFLGENMDKNRENYKFGIYSTKQSLNVENMANKPKKETMWQSITRGVTNLLGEHLTQGTSSFIKNLSSLNNPLSVTVVAPDFYKSLQQGKDDKIAHPSECLYTKKVWNKELYSNAETLQNILYDKENISDSVKNDYSDNSDSDKRWKEYKSLYVDFNSVQEKDLIKDIQNVNSVNTRDCKEKTSESNLNAVINDKEDMDKLVNFDNMLKDDDELVILEKSELNFEQEQQLQNQELQEHQHQGKQTQEKLIQPITVSSMLTNAYNKVVNGMVDLLQLKSASTCPDNESSFLFTKRACSPKPRPKKLHNISSGRGRGRAKSQLRRSGVSQTRHRKERSRYDNSEDIKSDIDNWEELEYCSSFEDDKFENVNVCDFASNEDKVPYTKRSMSFTLADIKPKKQKPKKGKNNRWTQIGMTYSVQSLKSDDVVENGYKDKVAYRSRLLSESSVDSEDSYCIVFENDYSEESDYETDEESCTEKKTESESEDEETKVATDIEVHQTKVRFNLTPVVHLMVTWNYAYRAARLGPWEEMMRDRERFHSRINNVGRVLEPILAKQHRTRIWHERFAD